MCAIESEKPYCKDLLVQSKAKSMIPVPFCSGETLLFHSEKRFQDADLASHNFT
jgi:hypothetical protein